MNELKSCANCGVLNSPDAVHCKTCRAQMVRDKSCTKCGAQNTANAKYCKICNSDSFIDAGPQGNNPELLPLWDDDIFPPAPGFYKVVTMKDRAFSGKFNPTVLEKALNDYAEAGWRLKSSTAAEFGGSVGQRTEMIFVLEQSSKGQTDHTRSARVVDGVLFLDGPLPAYQTGGAIQVSVYRQNALLSDLRRKMAAEAISKGANCVVEFSHSQTAARPLELLNPLKCDSESLSGYGRLARVPKSEMASVTAEILGPQDDESQ